MHRLIATLTATGCAALLLSAAACRPASQQDIRDLKEQIAALATKVEAIDTKLGDARPAARPTRPAEDFDKVYDIQVGTAPIRGPQQAPLTLVTYSDFQCPFCARADPIIKELQSKYQSELRVVFKHFPLSFHPAARPVALGSMAAQEQGKFWEWHDVVFENFETLQGDPQSLENYARTAGLDVERFKRDLETKEGEYEKRVDEDYQQGLNVDVRGTPTLYLNGKKLDPRTRSLEAMSALIDRMLAEAKG